MRRIVLALLVLAIVGGVAATVYYRRLTAPVEISNLPPVAATLSREDGLPGTVSTPSPPTTEPVITIAPPLPSEDIVPSTPPTGLIATETVPDSATEVRQPTGTVAPTERPRAAGPTAAPTRPPQPAARVYRIDPEQSTASYKVDETFAGVRGLSTAIGRTNAVAGEISVNRKNPAASRVGEIVVDISQLKSDDSSRDNAIRRRYLESQRYPLATFRNAKLSGMPATVTDGKPFNFRMTGDMTVHDTTRPVTWDVTATLNGDTLRGTARTQLKMSQFNVSAPNIAGFVRVEDDLELTLEFVARPVAQF